MAFRLGGQCVVPSCRGKAAARVTRDGPRFNDGRRGDGTHSVEMCKDHVAAHLRLLSKLMDKWGFMAFDVTITLYGQKRDLQGPSHHESEGARA